MKIRLKEIIVKLNEVIKDSKIKVTEDNLFSEACSFLRGEYAGENNFNRRLTCELKKLGLPTLNEQIESMEKANTEEHTEIAKHLVNTNGKVKLNRWLGTTALSLCFILLTAVITICVKVL